MSRDNNGLPAEVRKVPRKFQCAKQAAAAGLGREMVRHHKNRRFKREISGLLHVIPENLDTSGSRWRAAATATLRTPRTIESRFPGVRSWCTGRKMRLSYRKSASG